MAGQVEHISSLERRRADVRAAAQKVFRTQPLSENDIDVRRMIRVPTRCLSMLHSGTANDQRVRVGIMELQKVRTFDGKSESGQRSGYLA